MRSLKSVLEELFQGGHLPFNPSDARIWEIWADIVGGAVAKHARPCWIKHGRLRVLVSDPIWLQELKFMEESIRGKLNQRLSRTAVDRIEFRLDIKGEGPLGR